MADPAEVMKVLDERAAELDTLSKSMAAVERELDPLHRWHEQVLELVACELWDDYTAGKVSRLPGEDVRVALAHRQIRSTPDGAQNLTRLGELSAARKRMQSRIADLRTSVSAQQSILSALKEEMRAVGA